MTDNSNIILSDKILTDTLKRALAASVDLIIPASEDGRMPSAAELDLDAYINDGSGNLTPGVEDQLKTLDQVAQDQHGKDFADLDYATRQQLVDTIKTTQPDFLGLLAMQTIASYYQHDRVVAALGIEPRPPFPKGYTIAAGDLSLLDPVRKRRSFYREV